MTTPDPDEMATRAAAEALTILTMLGTPQVEANVWALRKLLQTLGLAAASVDLPEHSTRLAVIVESLLALEEDDGEVAEMIRDIAAKLPITGIDFDTEGQP